MAEETKQTSTSTRENTKKKGLPTIAIIGIGCLGLLMLVGIIISIAGRVIFSKFGANLIKQGIEAKTGVKVDTGNNGQTINITDNKTGEGISVGQASIPADFPKDFPIYPGSKPTGTLSGNGNNQSKGFWLVLSSTDSVEKIQTYYATNLKAKGWTITQTMTVAQAVTFAATKGTTTSSVIISQDKNAKETGIVISIVPEDNSNSVIPTDETTPEGSE
jgi:hypothetical protein